MSTLTGRIPLDANRFPVLAGVSSSDGLTVTTVYIDPTTHAILTKAAAATSGTGTNSSVVSSASSVTILAANANRKGATVYNDSTQVLYLLLGSTTASATNYTVQMTANAYYEVPFNYTGQLTGIWASANGNARVTELT